MQIHEDICFYGMHLLRACCDYECYNFGIAANFVFNTGVYYVEIYDIFVIIIKLYLNTVKSGTAAPFTGVYTH